MKCLIRFGLVAAFVGTLSLLPGQRFAPLIADGTKIRPAKATSAHSASGTLFMNPMTPAQRQVIEQAYAESNKHVQASGLKYESGDLAGAEQECLLAINTAPIRRGKRARLLTMESRLGQIYLREGRNEEALAAFQGSYNNIAYSTKDTDVALAYARLGNYAQAKRFYTERAITQYRLTEQPLKPSDLPGTASLTTLEASILFAEGIDEAQLDEKDYALDDFLAAGRLVPDNVLIAYYTAQALFEKGRCAEAIPLFEKVVASPRVAIYYDAKYNLYNAKIYVQQAKRAALKRAAK